MRDFIEYKMTKDRLAALVAVSDFTITILIYFEPCTFLCASVGFKIQFRFLGNIAQVVIFFWRLVTSPYNVVMPHPKDIYYYFAFTFDKYRLLLICQLVSILFFLIFILLSNK